MLCCSKKQRFIPTDKMSLDHRFAADSFGHEFALAQKEEWTDYYIDYVAIMNFLTEMKHNYREEPRRLTYRHRIRASASHLLDLVPQTETRELSSTPNSGGYALVKRMSEGALSLSRNVFHVDNRERLEEVQEEEGRYREAWGFESSDGSLNSEASVGPERPDSDQARLCAMLDDELEKVGLFFLQEQGRVSQTLLELAKRYGDLRLKMDQSYDPEEEFQIARATADKLAEEYRLAGRAILELFHFVAINMTVLRKLLNRHDAIVRKGLREKPPLLRRWYVLSRTSEKTRRGYLGTLLSHIALDALEGSVRRNIAHVIPSLLPMEEAAEVYGHSGEQHIGDRYRDFDIDRLVENIEAVASKMKRAEKRSFQDFVVEGSLGNDISFEPTVLGSKFNPVMDQGDADMHYYANWRKRERRKAIAADVASFSEGSKATEADTKWPLGLWLNLLSTFFYMINYFIAGPTSVKYIKALGGHGALASMVIGATPWAVMASTFIFSIWTNYSFKNPLIMSGLLLCIGNLMYASALHFESITLVMVGRMVIGFGGPRLINRRYIADTATIQQRTAVSAAFVTFSAAGTAVGPGLSVVLQHVDTILHVPILGPVKLNGLTAPGYFMLGLWLTFFVVMMVTFDEPERTGLQQQKNVTGHVKKESKDVICAPHENESLVKSQSNKGREEYGSASSDEDESGSFDVEKPEIDDGWCWMKMTWPVLMCLLLLFIDKLSIEALISSSPIITDNRYDWSVHMIGELGVLIGLLVIPLSICVGWLSRRIDDGKLLLWLLYFTAFGLILLLDISELGGAERSLATERRFLSGVGPHRYVYGCLFCFSGLQAMESIIMSTLSKVVPFSLAVGTCNSGLLNTEIGTFGRAIGDLLVTLIGFASLDNLLDLLVTPLLLAMGFCIILVTINYDVFRV